MNKKFLEDMRSYAEKYREKKFSRSGPHWPIVYRFTDLFDAYERALKEIEELKKDLLSKN